jgi:hypothetical protein
MPDFGFWVGLAIGIVLGFGASLVLFLPIVWRQTNLEDALDNRKMDLNLAVATIERVRVNLDALVADRDSRVLNEFFRPENGQITPLIQAKKGEKWQE